MATNPFDQFDSKANPFDQFDAATAGSTSTFKSGSAFEDTKNLIPDVSKMWDEFKKEWANRKNTPMTPEIAQKMMQDEHAAGSGVLDAVGALPAMAVGGAAGIGSALWNTDASKGLQTGSKVMNSLMPSTLLGNEEDQKKEGYKAAMAPFTVMMDTLNAAPQGYGEMLDAMGHHDAAGQLTDAGKLAIMATMGVKGAHEAYKGLTAKSKELPKIEDPRAKAPATNPFDQFDDHGGTVGNADDFGVVNPYDVGGHVTASDQGAPTTIDNPQGDLFGGQSMEQPAPAPVNQGSLLNTMYAIDYEPTSPLSLLPKGEETPATPPMGINMPEVDQQLSLVPKDQPAELTNVRNTEPNAMTNAMVEAQKDAAFTQRDQAQESQKASDTDAAYQEQERQKQSDYAKMEAQRELDHMNTANDVVSTPGRNFFTDPANRDKVDLHEAPTNTTTTLKMGEPVHMEVHHGWNGDPDQGAIIAYDAQGNQVGFMGFSKAEEADGTRHNPHVEVEPHMQRKGLATAMYDLAHQVGAKIPRLDQDGQMRTTEGQAFRESLHTSRDFAGEVIGDKSLMDHGPTGEMVDALHRGDVNGALDAIANNHTNSLYRKLADYLKGNLDGLNIKMHDEGILEMGDRQATGYYDPESHTVGLSKVGAVSPHTVLHELVHALTSRFINDRMGDMRVVGIKDLFNKLNEQGLSEKFPNVSNLKEFVAEAFSNPEFQDYLKQFRVNARSAWGRFVDTVKSILGFGKDGPTALDHVLDLSKQIIDAKPDSPLSQFRDAGVPSKLSDLMVSKQPEKPTPVVNNENMKAVRGLGKIAAQFDFTPLKPEEVIPMAREAADIPAGTVETIKANLDAGGRFASLRHNNNPVVKYTFAYVDHAVKNYEKWIKDNITNAKTGIKAMLRGLDEDDFTAVHQQLMLDEGQVERTPLQMRQLGWSDKMIEAAQRLRQVDKEMLDRVNEARAQMNPPLPPIEARIGHLAGRFLGDFYHTVYELNKDGTRSKAVMMITGSTKWGAQKLADFMQAEHPDWEVAKQEYNGIKKSQNSDRFSGFMEMMNYVAKNDKAVAKALDSLDKYNRRAATNYLNTLRHAKDKKVQAGGVIGSEGHKSWVDAKTNAEEGFKGHLAYLDTSAKWVEMQKAMSNISKVITDPEITKAQPNAIKWSTAYTDHALHRNQGFMTDMAQSLLSEVGRVTGVGHTNVTKAVNGMSTFEMRNWMGIGNIPFALKHMLLPFQKMPAMMAYMHSVGGLDPVRQSMAGLKSLSSYYHYLKDDAQTPFEKQAFQYAKDNNVFNVNLDNISGRIQSGPLRRVMGKIADADFSGPEHAIRGNSFFFYSHLLHDAGMEPKSAMSAAEHLSKFLYTDYAPHEAPRAAAKAGWIGQLAFQVTRYKANELGQLGFFNRERMSGPDHSFMEKMTSNAPLLTHMASLLAFSGAVGMLGYKEMDELYSLFCKHVLKSPDNLTALMQRSKAPDLVRYGLFSKIGIDPKISEAALLPSPFPTTAAEINQMGLAFDAARYHDKFHMQKLALGMAPSTLRGPLENKLFTQPPETKGPNVGKSLYLNPNTGEGRVWRTPEQQTLRNFGFHSTAETDETENSYAMSRIENDNRDIADHFLEKAKGLLASGSLTKEAAQELGRQYAQHQQAGQMDFAAALQSYAMKQHMSQREQMEIKAANDRGMGNSLGVIKRNQ